MIATSATGMVLGADNERQIMKTTSLKQDVRESIVTNSVVDVDTNGAPITDIMDALYVMDGVEDADYSKMENGRYDVWGMMDDNEFRLRVTTANA